MKFWRISPDRDLQAACRSMKAGRWNWASRDVLYTSATPELALLEALAHRHETSGIHYLSHVVVPDNARLRSLRELAPGWTSNRAYTRSIGNDWYDRCATLGLIVPSALCAEARNVLINPHHPQARGMRMVVLRTFNFNNRLLRCN